MKNILLFLTIFLVSDWTIVGPLKPHEKVVRTVALEAGRSTVEVWSDESGVRPGTASPVSCRFEGGSFTIENTKVPRCILTVSAGIPATMRVEITNESDKQIQYNIWIHDPK